MGVQALEALHLAFHALNQLPSNMRPSDVGVPKHTNKGYWNKSRMFHEYIRDVNKIAPGRMGVQAPEPLHEDCFIIFIIVGSISWGPITPVSWRLMICRQL